LRGLLLNPLQRRAPLRDGFPVAPGGFPIIGHLPAVATHYLELVRRCERELGPFFWIDVGFGQSQLHCMLPESFTIFKNKVTTSTYLQESLPDLFGGSLIAQDGPVHQHMRSAMTGPFLPRGLTASEVGAVFADLIERRVRVWREQRVIKILKETRELVLAIMFRMLGVDESQLSEWRHQYEELMLLTLNLPLDLPYTPKRRGRRARAWLNEHLLAFVQEARRRPDAPGLLAALVRARDEGGAQLSDDELLDNLRLLVLAGHETSASTMAWMVITLAQRPDVFDRLCDEAAAVGALPRTPKELRAFPFAEAVFRETLRLYPPVASDARRSITDFELGGRRVPAGKDITIAIVQLSRHPSLYERPDEFVPERWIGRGEGITPIEMVQFGGGPHFCLGYHLAWMEIVQFAVALATGMRAANVRPRLEGGTPAPRYLPLLHPQSSTRIRFA
jgi:cytochrome P450